MRIVELRLGMPGGKTVKTNRLTVMLPDGETEQNQLKLLREVENRRIEALSTMAKHNSSGPTTPGVEAQPLLL